MPFKHGKFEKPGGAIKNASKSSGEKAPKSQPEKGNGPMDAEGTPAKGKGPAPQGEQGKQPQHVTQSHPGETSPHPMTGVHAVHAHHKGGRYTTHTHHDGGDVETNQHGSAAEMHDHVAQALPDDGQGQQQQPPDMSADLGGIGGGNDGYGG